MKKLKVLLTPICVFSVLAFSITMSILETNTPKKENAFQTENTAKSIRTKTTTLGEKLSLSLNDTHIEMKLDNVETAVITAKDSEKNITVKRVYFQVYATIKNTGAKSFSFNSVPVFGISHDNHILISKNTGNLRSTNETVVTIDGIIPNQNSNLAGPFFEIKPGVEKNGYFLFENEVQNIQLLSNGVPYIWQTMKSGANIQGEEYPADNKFISPDNSVSFKIIKQQYQTIENKDLNLLYIEITNMSDKEISPFAFVPKYGLSIPGEVSPIETLSKDTSNKFGYSNLDEQTRLTAHSTSQYIIAFHQNVKYIFPQPPLIKDYSNIKIIL